MLCLDTHIYKFKSNKNLVLQNLPYPPWQPLQILTEIMSIPEPPAGT